MSIFKDHGEETDSDSFPSEVKPAIRSPDSTSVSDFDQLSDEDGKNLSKKDEPVVKKGTVRKQNSPSSDDENSNPDTPSPKEKTKPAKTFPKIRPKTDSIVSVKKSKPPKAKNPEKPDPNSFVVDGDVESGEGNPQYQREGTPQYQRDDPETPPAKSKKDIENERIEKIQKRGDQLLEDMKKVYDQDKEKSDKGEPPLGRLIFVRDVLRPQAPGKELFDYLLHKGILGELNDWMQPLQKNKAPIITLLEEIIRILSIHPIDANYLIESSIIKTVRSLTFPTNSNIEYARNRLLDKWRREVAQANTTVSDECTDNISEENKRHLSAPKSSISRSKNDLKLDHMVNKKKRNHQPELLRTGPEVFLNLPKNTFRNEREDSRENDDEAIEVRGKRKIHAPTVQTSNIRRKLNQIRKKK